MHVLTSLPFSTRPSLQTREHVSPALGPPLSPYSQSIVPFSRVRGAHMSVTCAILSKNNKQYFGFLQLHIVYTLDHTYAITIVIQEGLVGGEHTQIKMLVIREKC